MKVLKYLGIGVISLVALVLILGLIAPTKNHIERSVTIDASPDQIRPLVATFEGMEQWSPWREYDPDQEVSIENDGQVGATYRWNGNDSVGEGVQEITALEPNKVVTHINFIRPFESEADATLTMKEVEEGTQVTWSYDDEMPYPSNVMNLFINMDDFLGPDYERGMKYLKELAESIEPEVTETPTMAVTEVELDPRVYIGVKDQVKMTELAAFFQENFGKAYGGVSEAKLEMRGMPSAIYYDWNDEEGTTELMAGVPVAEGEVEGLTSEPVAGKALLVDYYGPYEEVASAHELMDTYLEENGLSTHLVIEEYVTDPTTEPDTSKWLTKVYYLLASPEA